MDRLASDQPAHAAPLGTSDGQERKRRILFVDDERAILDGLRAVLRTQRREWDMVFAQGGPAALEEVKKAPFDVVVTDMRMPVIDGAELLRQVKELQPRAVRIVLSGQTDAESAMKTVFTAHQFLAKPCDVEKVRSAVKRACDLHELVLAERLQARAGEVALLPTAPGTYQAITRALANPNCTIGEVAAIVEREPALCAKVLQVVNSAFFGLPRSVTSIKQATSYLGTMTLRNLALAMETVAATKQAGSNLSPGQLAAFQTNSLLVGLLCRHWFAGDRKKADEAFVAGMLRDMGHLVLSAQGERERGEDDDHAALSAYLLGLWGLPYGLLEAVAHHEHPERIEHDSLEVVDVVHLADRVAAELMPSPFQPEPVGLDRARFQRLGVGEERIERLRQDAKDLLKQARELLST